MSKTPPSLREFLDYFAEEEGDELEGNELKGFTIAIKTMRQWIRDGGDEFTDLCNRLDGDAEAIVLGSTAQGFNRAVWGFNGAICAMEYFADSE